MSDIESQELTPFQTRCQILGELWLSYRDSEEYKDFVKYNDLGLPLAYAIAEGIVQPSDTAESFINESWSMLLGGFEIEDEGFESLEQLLNEEL